MEFGVDNLQASIARNPELADEAIHHAVASIVEVVRSQDSLGRESWKETQSCIYPMIRQDSIVHSLNDHSVKDETEFELEQRRIVATPWLADLVVCYAIDQERTFRMINQADLQRWGIDAAELHQRAMSNLQASQIPQIAKFVSPDGTKWFGGLGEGGLSSKSSYVLHPDLYRVVTSTLGPATWVAIPSRDSLMIFPKACTNRTQLQNAVAKDYRTTDHRLSDRLFELTPDGMVLA